MGHMLLSLPLCTKFERMKPSRAEALHRKRLNYQFRLTVEALFWDWLQLVIVTMS